MYKNRGHPLSTYPEFSEKLTFLTPWYAHAHVRVKGLEILVFRKIPQTYLMNDPLTALTLGLNLKITAYLPCLEQLVG